MRRDWFSTHVAAAVAAPLMLGLQPSEAAAVAPELAASKSLAQVTMPGQMSAATTDGGAVATDPSATTETVSTKTAVPEAGNPAEGDAVASNGQELVPGVESDAIPPGPEGNVPFAPRGDDELPSQENMPNNPYLRAGSPTSLQEEGRTTGDQEYGAFVPPTVTETEEVTSGEAGTEMLNILGEEVYNRRVNISTPPDTEVAEVIRILAERANLNFVYGQGVIKGRITLNLRDVPLGVALQSLLSSQDLAIVREGANVMRIAPREVVRPGNVDMRTIYIRLNWVTADTLQSTLNSVLSGTGGSIKAHKETNTIIITDAAPNVALMRDLVAQLDVPDKQVMIEARLVEMIHNTTRDLNSNTGISRSRADNFELPRGFSEDTGVFEGLAGGTFTFGGILSVLGSDFNIATELNALEQRGVANVLANPRVITLNNQEAEIDIEREIPYFEAQQGVTDGVTAVTVKFKEAGIRLAVLPVITNNGYVRMKLTPEQRILADFVDSPTGDVPVIDRRTAITNVIVKDEDTAVLGGLRQIEANDSKTQVPWIGQAPIIGWLFKNDGKRHLKNDLMLFVTPHIVKSPVLTPAENYKYSRIDAHWDLPDFFFDDSVGQREARHRFEMDGNPREFYPQTLKLPPVVDVQEDLTGTTGAELEVGPEAGAVIDTGIGAEGPK